MKKLVLSVALGALLAACAPEVPETETDAAAPAAETAAPPARSASDEIHFRTLVLDTHLDTPAYFHDPEYNFSKRGDFDVDGTHVDLPRMNEGGLDGGFWVIFTPRRASLSAQAESAATVRSIAASESRPVCISPSPRRSTH